MAASVKGWPSTGWRSWDTSARRLARGYIMMDMKGPMLLRLERSSLMTFWSMSCELLHVYWRILTNNTHLTSQYDLKIWWEDTWASTTWSAPWNKRTCAYAIRWSHLPHKWPPALTLAEEWATTSEKEWEWMANSLLWLDHWDDWTAHTQSRTDYWTSLQGERMRMIASNLQRLARLSTLERTMMPGGIWSNFETKPKLQTIYLNTHTLVKLASGSLIAHLPMKVLHLMHSMLTTWMSTLAAPLQSLCISPSSLSTIHLLNLANLILEACHKTWSTQLITQNRSCEDCQRVWKQYLRSGCQCVMSWWQDRMEKWMESVNSARNPRWRRTWRGRLQRQRLWDKKMG